MTETDIQFGALCAWRENRGGGKDGMHSVINVILNRSRAWGKSVYSIVTQFEQFSSMTAPGDPQLKNFPDDGDIDFAMCLAMLEAGDSLVDITGGATDYYATYLDNPPHKPPYWAASYTPTVEIAGQRFFKR